MILPSLTRIRVCFLEMLTLGRQMSFSSTRPMVISSHSKSSRCVGPPFSVRMTLNDIWLGPPPEAQEYLAVVPRSKGAAVARAARLLPGLIDSVRRGLVHLVGSIEREVYERDGGRCTFSDERGRRCGETGALEFDHLDGFARTRLHRADRIRLLCRPYT